MTAITSLGKEFRARFLVGVGPVDSFIVPISLFEARNS